MSYLTLLQDTAAYYGAVLFESEYRGENNGKS